MIEPLFRAELEKRGEASVRADLEAGHWGIRRANVLEWLNEKDLERQAARDAMEARVADATLSSSQSAEASAVAAKQAAAANIESARWSKWAVIISVAALVVAILK